MLRALKRRFPGAHLAVSVPLSNKDLLVHNPHVDSIVVRPKLRSWGAKFRFAYEIRKSGYDLIVSVQEKSLFYAWATWSAAAGRADRPVTLALDHPRTRRWYQYNSPVRPHQHEVYKYLELAALLGCEQEPHPALELQVDDETRARLGPYVASKGFSPEARFIGINPGGSKREKRWPVDRLAAVANRLHRELDLPIVIFGGPDDHPRAIAIADQMTHPPLVAAGRTTLTDTAGLLERCDLLVTGDTGPMHMAVALGVPVVALFGPTNPVKFGPFTGHPNKAVLRHAEPCPKCRQPCLHTITVEECVAAALALCSQGSGFRVQGSAYEVQEQAVGSRQ
jgi:lipopolysaccharide heptosyltransferase II